MNIPMSVIGAMYADNLGRESDGSGHGGAH